MVLKVCTFRTNKIPTVFTYQMFWVYSVLTHISQMEFPQVSFCFLTLFLLFVDARYYYAIPFVDHFLITKYYIFYLSCYQNLLATLWLLKCSRTANILGNKPWPGRWTHLRPFLIIMYFSHAPCCQQKLELECNKVLVLRCTKGATFHQIEFQI